MDCDNCALEQDSAGCIHRRARVRWCFLEVDKAPETPKPISYTEFVGQASVLPGLTKDESVEINTIREMTIKQAGTRGTLRFIELWTKIGDALYEDWSKA